MENYQSFWKSEPHITMQNWKGLFRGLGFLSLHFKLLIFCIVRTGHMWKSADNFGSWFSPPTMWILTTKLSPSDLTASTSGLFSWTHCLVFWYKHTVLVTMVDEEKKLSDLDCGICRPRHYSLSFLKGNLKFSQCPSKILNQKKKGLLY